MDILLFCCCCFVDEDDYRQHQSHTPTTSKNKPSLPTTSPPDIGAQPTPPSTSPIESEIVLTSSSSAPTNTTGTSTTNPSGVTSTSLNDPNEETEIDFSHQETEAVIDDPGKIITEATVSVPTNVDGEVPAPGPVTDGAILTAPNEARAGSTIDVEWIGPNNSNDHIAIFDKGNGTRINYTYTRDGTPVKLLLPSKPGLYEIKYLSGSDHTALTSISITLIAAVVTLAAPNEARTGATINVDWTGPNDNNDMIAIYDTSKNIRINYTNTRNGTPAKLTLPTKAGSYNINYINGIDHRILATVPIQLIQAEATITAPTEGRVGSTIHVEWTGPNDSGDHIAIYDQKSRIHYVYTNTGSPVKLIMPTKAGTYDIKYVVGQDHSILTSVPITLLTTTAMIIAPTEGLAGSTIEVEWTGPNNSGDYIGICKSGIKKVLYYDFTSKGNPTNIILPTQPGLYELKYFVGQDDSILTSTPITVVAVEATLSGPKEGPAGSTIEVAWTGPNNSGDYIGICKLGAKNSLHYALTSQGNPARITLPTQAGSYELKYFVGQDDCILTSAPITIVAVQATLSGPMEGPAGSTIEVAWTGPNNSGDYIGICKSGTNDSLQYTYTTSNPATIMLPTTAGTYEIKYFVGQDNSVLASFPITIIAPTAKLDVPINGVAGSTVEVKWTGPQYSGDYIGICVAGRTETLEYVYTSQGNPVSINLPTKPGSYEIKYFLGQDNSALVSKSLTVSK